MLSFASDSLAASIVLLVLLAILFVLVDSAAVVVVKRTILVSSLVSEEVFILLGLLVPGLWVLFYVSLALWAVTIVIGVLLNESEFKIYLARNFKGVTAGNSKKHPNAGEALFDREAVYNEVYLAVVGMSRKKEGALITFMRKDNILADFYLGTIVTQRGVNLNSPVKHELLETIFYEGTRLHDGAVVIVNDKIARASVFFKPTEKPLIGKFGSRHQAALGISENSDSVTIIVSEETGRISIAFQGELTPVTPDTLMRVFLEDMSIEEEEHREDEH